MIDYEKRLVEVDEVLNYLSEENLNKIPEDIRNLIKENKDKNYTWKFDEKKELKEQDLSKDTIIILSYLNMEYLLNEEQKKLMEQIYELNEKKQIEERKEKYKVDEIFKNKEATNQQINEIKDIQEQSIIEYKENIFKRIIKKIKEFLTFGRKIKK
ncbi:MAG: hypothetical protein IJN50_04835 [Clostridia bacterium]|nr:hypothetical protein [Clostridia bacterium]